MKNFDDLANDYANASTDDERIAIAAEVDELNHKVTEEIQTSAPFDITAYDWMIGKTKQAHVTKLKAPNARCGE